MSFGGSGGVGGDWALQRHRLLLYAVLASRWAAGGPSPLCAPSTAGIKLCGCNWRLTVLHVL